MSQKERERLKVMGQVKIQKMAQRDAAAILGLSVRQVRRLLRRYEEHGDAGLVHQLRGRRSNRWMDLAVRDQAIGLIGARYNDLEMVWFRIRP